MPEAHVVLAAREDARRIERLQRRRQERGEHYSFTTHFAYAAVDASGFLYGFIRGHLSIQRMNRFRKKAKVPAATVIIFKQLMMLRGGVS